MSTNDKLRPSSFDELVGQEAAKTRLKIALGAAKQRGEAVPHILFGGSSPGIGKTTLAHVVANEYGAKSHYLNSPAIKKVSELSHMLAKLNTNDVLILDECHALSKGVSEILLPAMEDNKLTIKIVNRVATIPLPPFTLIGCTTEVGSIIRPLRDRFKIQFNLQPYTDDDISKIVFQNCIKLKLQCQDGVDRNVAFRSRGFPELQTDCLNVLETSHNLRGKRSLLMT